VKAITSADNARFRGRLQLAESSREVRQQQRSLAEGLHLLQAARRAGARIDVLLIRRGLPARDEAERLLASCAADGIECVELGAALYDRIAPVEHGAGLCGVIVTAPADPAALTEGDLLYLDGVQEPGNVGALIRVAAAAGVRLVLAGPGTAALWSPRALRAGQGAHFGVGLLEGVPAPALAGFGAATWLALDAHAGESLWTARWPAARVGWIVGAEGAGVSTAARGACQQAIRIPQSAAAESLNVAAAAAVALFERCRRLALDDAASLAVSRS